MNWSGSLKVPRIEHLHYIYNNFQNNFQQFSFPYYLSTPESD